MVYRFERVGGEEARALRDERLGYLGCRCASCSTVSGLEFDLSERSLKSGRKTNELHEYLAMRAYGADRIGGGGFGWYVYEAYVAIIALVRRIDRFGTDWDFDDDYVVAAREEAMRLAEAAGIGPDLGFDLKLVEIRAHLDKMGPLRVMTRE